MTATGSLHASAPLPHQTWPDHACCIAQAHTSAEEHERPARDSKGRLTEPAPPNRDGRGIRPMQGAARARNALAAGWMAQASVHPSREAQQAQPPPTTCKPLLNEPLDFKSQRNTSTALVRRCPVPPMSECPSCGVAI